jgi:nitronate monooxygenase
VRGTTPLHQLLPEVVSAVEVPVLAAGGLADAPDFVTCLGLGAEGMVLGTALIPTTESFAHDVHKERLLAAASEDTVLTHAFHHNWPPGAAVRVLQSEVTGGRRGDPYASGRTVIGWEEGRPISLFSTDSPLRSTAGDLGAMALYAGMGVGRVSKMVGAGRRIAGIVAEAETLLAPPPSARPHSEPSSPVCYIGEVDPAYMGYLDRPALARGLIDLRDAAPAELTPIPPRARPGEAVRPAALRLARWAVRLERCAARQATAPAAAGAAGTAAVGTLPERARSLMPLVIDDEVRALLQAMIADLEANSPAPAESAVPAC